MKTHRYIFSSIGKVLLVLIFSICLFFAGLIIGFGVIGDGSPMQVFDKELWIKIIQFIK